MNIKKKILLYIALGYGVIILLPYIPLAAPLANHETVVMIRVFPLWIIEKGSVAILSPIVWATIIGIYLWKRL